MQSTKSLLIVSIACLWLSACATNPVTGKRELSLVGEEWELGIGKQQYAPSRQSQGGEYTADPAVQAYITEVGNKLAAVSDRKLPYEFKVLNSGVPNAWALPGGKIAINRGLLVEMNSEAELASVLGHEIVHAAAKHGAKGFSRGMLLQTGVMAATIATSGKKYSNLAQLGAGVGAQLINTRYGRDAERESDRYGMEYMSRAGYDPVGAVDLQRTFVKLSEGRRQDFISGLFASHPPSQERLDSNIKLVQALPKGGEIGRERYQSIIGKLKRDKPAYDAYEEGKKALSDGDVVKARQLARKAIAAVPREGHFHSLLGDAEQAANRHQNARKHYVDAIKVNPNFFYYHLQHGLSSEKLRDHTTARRALERSIKLLPTADAHNALGNVARLTGQRDVALAQYRKAAASQSAAGKAALNSLVDLDFGSNPGSYVVARHQVQSNGSVKLQLTNKTPRAVNNIAIVIRYPDTAGRMREARPRLTGTVAAGKSQVIDLPIKVNPKLANRVQVGVVRANLLN
jgi:predicted Zn-dependent protease